MMSAASGEPRQITARLGLACVSLGFPEETLESLRIADVCSEPHHFHCQASLGMLRIRRSPVAQIVTT